MSEPAATAVARKGLLIGVATGLYGISFGALAATAGLDVWQAVALSALLFSGGSQFALVGVLGAGGTGAAAVTTSAMLGLRNGFYGLQVSRLIQKRGLRRILAAHLTIDESTAVTIAQPNTRLARVGFWATGGAVFVFWNAMTAVGAVLGNAMGDPKAWGLDAAAAAAFIALLWPRLTTTRARLTALAAAAIALLTTPHAPPGTPILVAATAAVVAGLLPHGETVEDEGL
ncbi:AzlC family ABC transporter permease [Calidifontibacter sp. DB0510]|uniref:AzlC family ABC transporter permease n=1 Tax=Metallococcus carri TaxID=1656884 RepID=A0A967B204_9MICO|nr:AzlC family ABC transporter permease [Metallococcus carri]NHN55925.1 AzlC family ABC transporter permease [Metallococcus carri]NOP38387.1 AzlC family ABC transporter permease [Calidifontibacter sp. DB2511S]